MAVMATPQVIEQLNGFLRGELSAVQTYKQALAKVKDTNAREELETAKRSHETRVDTLRRRIQELGGKPTESSGAWGAFVNVLEKIGSAVGDRPAVAVLEEGEDHGLKDYRVDLTKLDAETRRIVEQELLPAQQSTHRALSTLKAALH
jgi:uncharacterized protein (TIGR02284 family)